MQGNSRNFYALLLISRFCVWKSKDKSVWRTRSDFKRILIRIPLFILIRIRIRILFSLEKKNFKCRTIVLQNLTKLVMCYYLIDNKQKYFLGGNGEGEVWVRRGDEMEFGSVLDPDPWEIFRIRIRQTDTDSWIRIRNTGTNVPVCHYSVIG